MARRLPRRTAVIVAATAFVLLALTACTPSRDQVSPTSRPTVATSQAGGPTASLDVYNQQISWAPCGDLECATVKVPVDWTDPAGATIEIAINRHKAAGEAYGSLLINPGGPGGSGLDLTDAFVAEAGADLLAHYDVVGFDPRGVGKSSPINCGDTATVNDYVVTDYQLQTEADVEASRARNAAFAQVCLAASGPIVKNADTASAARDMDVIRAALGDKQLTYLGFSYGTQLGATYAELFPQNVGRMVLDGAVDFLRSPDELAAGQAKGFEGALTSFITWCEKQSDCPLDSNVEAARRQIHDIAVGAIAHPLPGVRESVNGNLMVYGIVVTLYDQASWKYLKLGLGEVLQQKQATVMAQLADFYLDRNSTTGDYTTNSTVAFTAINCLDNTDHSTWDIARVNSFRALMEQNSPTFGWWFANSTSCDGWPFQGHDPVTSLADAHTAAPILVVGTTNDPATPYAWAQSLTDRLGNATLLTYKGEGHTAYGRSNQCIIDAVDGYLVNGVMPDSGKTC